MCCCFSFSLSAQNVLAPAEQISAIAQQQKSITIQQQSIERHREVVHKQTVLQSAAFDRQARSFELAANVLGAPPSGCAAVSPLLLDRAVQEAATSYNVAPILINAVIQQESGGYPCAVSEKGAMGLMQLMPATAAELGATEPFNVDQNVSAGTRLLAELMQRYSGDLNRVLGAYNAGPAAVDRFGGPPAFPETVNYIRSVLGQINSYTGPKLFDSPIR